MSTCAPAAFSRSRGISSSDCSKPLVARMRMRLLASSDAMMFLRFGGPGLTGNSIAGFVEHEKGGPKGPPGWIDGLLGPHPNPPPASGRGSALPFLVIEERTKFATPARMLQLAQRLGFDLTDAFARPRE